MLDYQVNGKDAVKKFTSIRYLEAVCRKSDDPASVISESPASDFDRLVQEGIIKGGMIPKVEARMRVVKGGVDKGAHHRLQGRRRKVNTPTGFLKSSK